LKLTAPDLLSVGIIDRIIPEPLGGAHQNPEVMYETMKKVLNEEISSLQQNEKFSDGAALDRRVAKFAKMGFWKN